MLPGAESMGAPLSFTARRPNASHLPQFELPPVQLPGFQKYQHSFGGLSASQPNSGASLTSVGNLLTPPSASSPDGINPISSAIGVSQSMTTPYTPGAYSWQPPSAGSTPHGYQSSMSPSAFNPIRAPFSPSLSSIVKNASAGNTGDAGHVNEVQSYPISAPLNLPSMPTSHQSMNMLAQGPMSAPVTQASPAASQEAFARPHQPPTPTYYNAPHSTTPVQTPFQYSAGPSPIQQSPVSTSGPISRMSPPNSQGQIPPIHPQSPYAAQRPFSYPLPGPVLSNMNNPGSQMALMGSMSGGMMGYNSGHAAQMQQMYGHGPGGPGMVNDRPFKCDQCPQSFNRNHDLKRHKRIHLAVKPFPCGHCEKSFSRKDALKRHILVKGCGKSSSRSEVDRRSDGSISPSRKSDITSSSPVIAAPA